MADMLKGKNTLDDFMATLSPQQQATIKNRTQELLAGIEWLCELREAPDRPHDQLAKRSAENQVTTSKHLTH
jgi:hypothetical protein